MKPRGILSMFLFFTIIFSTTMKTSQNNAIDLDPSLHGFKCFPETQINTPIRINLKNQIECFSVNGQNCVEGINSLALCKDLVAAKRNTLKPVVCSDKDNAKWCVLARKFFRRQWHCPNDTSLEVAVRIKSNGDIECLTKNGKDCFHGSTAQRACLHANKCDKFNKRMKRLKCGKEHKRYWGHNGYFFANEHWCKKAFAYFKFTDDFIFPDSINLSTAVRINKNGDIACISNDGKNCVWKREIATDLAKQSISGNKKVHTLTCGIQHRNLYRTSGYGNERHWCTKAYRYLIKGDVKLDSYNWISNSKINFKLNKDNDKGNKKGSPSRKTRRVKNKKLTNKLANDLLQSEKEKWKKERKTYLNTVGKKL